MSERESAIQPNGTHEKARVVEPLLFYRSKRYGVDYAVAVPRLSNLRSIEATIRKEMKKGSIFEMKIASDIDVESGRGVGGILVRPHHFKEARELGVDGKEHFIAKIMDAVSDSELVVFNRLSLKR